MTETEFKLAVLKLLDEIVEQLPPAGLHTHSKHELLEKIDALRTYTKAAQ